MIPILEAAQIPGIFAYAFFLMVILGIPTAIMSLVIFFVLEQVPFPKVRLLLPAAGAVLMIAVSLIFFTRYQSEAEYQKTWALMMMNSFFLNALVILAPFLFIRRYISRYSPYLVPGLSVPATFYLLACFGFIGGEIKMPLDPA
jgi:hypothetical protein